MDNSLFSYHKKALIIPILAVVSIWMVYYIEIRFRLNFNDLGIYPKSLKGLRGVFLSPFIHSDAKHLVNNSVPLAVLLSGLYFFYRKIATKVLLAGLLFTGILTWSFARPAYHIGASGIIYFLISFIFFSGIFRKYYRLVALSLIVVFLYGSMVWYIFPVEERISWEGHLSGFIVGFVVAFLFRRLGPQIEKFEFSENEEFEQLFDEEGNFNPPVENEEETEK